MAGNGQPTADLKTLWKAEFSSRHFDFEAYGNTKLGACEALKLGLKRHAKQTKIPSDWFEESDIIVNEFKVGCAYCDRSKI